ncbi:MAG: tetratricopeptide repeat protein [Candidatus Brocadiaceae bacterium]|nr:tetratricopeptide repeat protein [Candidatus Brocadiaceae bacterium]
MQSVYSQTGSVANKQYLDAYNLYKLGKLDESLNMLRKVVEMNPDHPEAHFGMGSIYFRQNNFEEAVKEFTTVTRIKPKYVEAYQRLWLAYKKLGMNDKAEQELLKYKKLIEERMQAMTGGASKVVKPVKPQPEEEPVEKDSPPEETAPLKVEAEAPQPVKTKPPREPLPEKSIPLSSPQRATGEQTDIRDADEQIETRKEDRTAVAQTDSQAPITPRPPPAPIEESRPMETRPLSPLSEMLYRPTLNKDSVSPYITVHKKKRSFLDSINKIGSILFKNPFKKDGDTSKRAYFGKLFRGFFYYVIIVQVWLCIAAGFCVYFSKSKK